MRTTSPWARVTANMRGNHSKKTSQSSREGNGEHRRREHRCNRKGRSDTVRPLGETYSQNHQREELCIPPIKQIPATPPRDRVGIKECAAVEETPP